MIGFFQRSTCREDDAAFQALCDAVRSLARLLTAEHVRLPEIRRIRVEDQWLPAAQLMAQYRGEARVPPFRHAPGFGCQVRFLIIELEADVLGLADLEVERLILT